MSNRAFAKCSVKSYDGVVTQPMHLTTSAAEIMEVDPSHQIFLAPHVSIFLMPAGIVDEPPMNLQSFLIIKPLSTVGALNCSIQLEADILNGTITRMCHPPRTVFPPC